MFYRITNFINCYFFILSRWNKKGGTQNEGEEEMEQNEETSTNIIPDMIDLVNKFQNVQTLRTWAEKNQLMELESVKTRIRVLEDQEESSVIRQNAPNMSDNYVESRANDNVSTESLEEFHRLLDELNDIPSDSFTNSSSIDTFHNTPDELPYLISVPIRLSNKGLDYSSKTDKNMSREKPNVEASIRSGFPHAGDHINNRKADEQLPSIDWSFLQLDQIGLGTLVTSTQKIPCLTFFAKQKKNTFAKTAAKEITYQIRFTDD
ncbi:unnamed protein product [Mytilus coruscus]|uniref:Uncharacterized protein n=1 Tax=Mytilus coruscus TaxID=42192 RepID=A0A6J8B6B9_MYTCO|nr:unnamed protein product [Mytilus coruscus]